MNDDEIEELRAEIALFRRVIERFVDNPFIYQAPSFRGLIKELGYEFVISRTRRPFRKSLEEIVGIRKTDKPT